MSGTRIAWITGGGSGIGRALALELANHGWHVAVTGRTLETLEEVAAAAPEGTVRAFPADVTDLAATREAVRAVESEMGPIELAVLNAGVFKPFSPEKFDADTVNATMRVNYDGAVNGIDAVLPGMRGRGRGRIALVSSVAGYRGLPLAAPYSASKAALIALAESLKFDLDGMGIGVSVVNPGFVKTPLTAKNKFPMPALMEVDDAARRIRTGLEAGRFEVAFPRRLVYALKFMRLLPYRLYFPLTRKATGR